ncbi:MAG: tRNA (guanosine(37)-N1)-methyltransferase TrmD [Candidatus Paceibacterota bacterium]
MNFHIITLFPDSFSSYLGESILARAIKNNLINVKFYNPRDFSEDKRKRVDYKPYGGGPGMVLQAMPYIKAIENAFENIADKKKAMVIFLSPSGKQFTNKVAIGFKKKKDIVIICGRYEGVDARVTKIFKAKEFSIGPYVLTGGELPAMAIIDCVSRQIEGVLGDFGSLEDDRVSSPDVYTRPETLSYKGKNYKVPKVLLSGHHQKIDEWRNSRKDLKNKSA